MPFPSTVRGKANPSFTAVTQADVVCPYFFDPDDPQAPATKDFFIQYVYQVNWAGGLMEYHYIDVSDDYF